MSVVCYRCPTSGEEVTTAIETGSDTLVTATRKTTITAIPARFSASPPSVRRLWPALGEHTEEVLRETGYDDAAISAITQR